ncbi:MAG: HAD-IA family hydrolase [Nanoarchaeota archaeon]
MDNKIKAIVFDIGSVLTKTDFKKFHARLDRLSEEHEIDPNKFHDLRSKHLDKLMIGKMSDKEFKRKVTNELKIKDKKDFIIKWDNALESYMILDKRVYSLIAKLKKNYLVVSFSDVTPMFHKMRVRKKVYAHFKYNLLSHQIGIKKPSLKFYKLLLKKIKVKPNEIIFIDDKVYNLSPAENLGMKTILYKNNKQLIKDLKKLEVKLK